MKKLILLTGIVALTSCGVHKTQSQPQPTVLNNGLDSMAYAQGYSIGSYFNKNVEDPNMPKIDVDLFVQGLSDAMHKVEQTPFNEESANQFAKTYMEEFQAKQLAEDKAKNEQFLKENGTREGIKTTESGLQYEITEMGQGERATVEDTVVVHYKGMTIDGKEFDSSYKRNEPAKFALLQVIPGWTEGLCLFPEGSKGKLYIPSQLAYGERGAGRHIKPNATLIFEIEVIEVIKGEPIPVTSVIDENNQEIKTN